MAYAFSRTMQALGSNGPGEEENQGNIFQQPAPQNAPSGGSPQYLRASSTEGDIMPSQSQSSGSFAPPASSAPGPSTTGAKNRLFSANVGRVKAPINLQGVSKTVQDANASVAAESNAYVSGVAKPFALDNDGTLNDDHTRQFDDFVNTGENHPGLGDEGIPAFNVPNAYTPAFNVVNAYNDDPAQVDDYTFRTNTDFEDLRNISTDAGLNSLFRGSGDAEYGGNEASLDTALLRKDAGFNQERDTVLNDGRAAMDAIDRIRANTRGRAQDSRDGALSSWRDAANRDLTGRTGAIEAAARAREKSFDEGLGFTPSGPLESSFDYRDGVDASKFRTAATLNADETSWQDFVNEPEFQNFNRIRGLMGKGDNLVGKGKFDGKNAHDFSAQFDRDGYLAEGEKVRAESARQEQMRQEAASAFGGAYDARPFVGPARYAPDFPRLDPILDPSLDPRWVQHWNIPGDPHNDPIIPDFIERPVERFGDDLFSGDLGKKIFKGWK